MRGTREGLLLGLLTVLLLGGLWAAPAGAHATVVSSSPEDGSTLEESPDEVSIVFTEAVSLEPDGLEVLDSEGEVVDAGDAEYGAAETEIKVALPADLPDGTYVASYRVISADGHPITGAIIFGVGVDPDAAATEGVGLDPDQARGWRIMGGVGRFLLYTGALVAIGLAVYLAFVSDGGTEQPRLRRLLLIAAVTALLAQGWIVLVQVALSSGLGWDGLTDGDAYRVALGKGLGWQLVLVPLGLLLLSLSAFMKRSGARVVVPAAALLTGAGFAVWGHPRVGDPAWLALVGDAVHFVVAGVWMGGLVGLAITLFARRDDPALAGIVERVSGLAAISVVVLGVAGLALAWSELGGLAPLFDTDYGRLLLIKLAILGVVLAGAAYNRWRLVPAMRSEEDADGAPDGDRAPAHLRSTLIAELCGLLLILGVTSALVDVTPPVNAAETAAETAADTPGPAPGAGGEFHGEAAVGDTTLTIDVLPGRPGSNEIHLSYLGADGALADIADSVEIDFTLPAESLGPITREATELTGGHYTYAGNDMSLAGEWEIVVRTRISRFEQEESAFTVPIGD